MNFNQTGCLRERCLLRRTPASDKPVILKVKADGETEVLRVNLCSGKKNA